MPRLSNAVKSASQTGERIVSRNLRQQAYSIPDTTTRVIRVRTLSAAARTGWLTLGPLRFPCAIGRNGITRRGREGDWATPAGRYRLLAVFYRADRGSRPRTLLPVRATRPDDGWCDAPGDRNYNSHVRRPYPASSETLWRDDCLYDISVVLDHNQRPRKRNDGSAIFFHVAKPGFPPTAGCIAISAPAMRCILAAAGRDCVIEIG
ncbi:MAG: L,D-transpeptidase catalytic domain protein [Hyphomicrobiales bacterium]|nr:MAG: L,D-transpeptidase catalytic domain protein [Hyphomicrobiales bacterium]